MIVPVLIVLSTLGYLQLRRQAKIKQWSNQLQLDKHILIYHRLFAPIDGFSLSRKARSTQDALEYVYGEIEFMTFIALLSLVKPGPHTVFYDLGSGTGKAVIACAMVFNVKKSCGIELFHELHTCAQTQQKNLAKVPTYLEITKNIHFIHDDFLTADFNDATLIFINATSFFGPSWEQLNARLAHANHCQTVITTSKKLLSTAYIITQETCVRMSWGIVKAYIHKRCE